jgi:pimeloyl-ACP methyl ester carboxylesterase
MSQASTATAQRLHIAYDDLGEGEPTVVFVHGLFANRTYYEAQVRHLASRHRVVAIDLRGHGESDDPKQGYTLDALADDVIGVCERAGVTRAVLCGHSIGIALRVASRRPDLAAGLVLLDGAVLMPPPAHQLMNQLVAALQTDAWREVLLGFFSAPERAGSAAQRVGADIAAIPRSYVAPLMQAIVDACITTSEHANELAALRCPLLFVHCEIPTDLGLLMKVAPDAFIERLPGVGHYPMLTAPDELNSILDRFLEVIA